MVDLFPFEEVAIIDVSGELLWREEVIVDAVLFAGARFATGSRDRELEKVVVRHNMTDDSGLATTRRGRKKDSLASRHN